MTETMRCPNCERLEQDRSVAVCKNVALMGQVKELEAEVERLRREIDSLRPDPTKPMLIVNGNPIYPPATPTLRMHLTDRVVEGDEAADWMRKRRLWESET